MLDVAVGGLGGHARRRLGDRRRDQCLDLVGAGSTGDHRADDRHGCQSTDRDIDHRQAASLGVRGDSFDPVEVCGFEAVGLVRPGHPAAVRARCARVRTCLTSRPDASG